MKRSLRLLAIALVLFASLCGAEVAHASGCPSTGAMVIKISPCPLTSTQRYKGEDLVNFSAELIDPSDHFLVPGYYRISYSGPDFTASSYAFSEEFSPLRFQIVPRETLTVGVHAGVITLSLCKDKFCKDVYGTVQIPYRLNVITVPVLSRLSPSWGTVGDAPFTLKVLGNYFKSDYKIRFNGSALSTKVVSSAELTARVNLSAVAAGRTYEIQVFSDTAGFRSNKLAFTLKNPTPVLTAISPNALFTGAAPFTLQVTGSDFMRISTILMDGKPITTQFISSTQLTASVDLSAQPVGTHTFVVTTAAPGGGTTSQATLSITNPVPVITSISPSVLTIGRATFTFSSISITGSGFQHNSMVEVNGVIRPTGYGSSTSIGASGFTPLEFNAAGYYPVVVVTPGPGGGTSNTVNLEIDNVAPTLTWVSPIRAYAGSGDIVVTAKGGSFAPNTVLEWNGVPLTTLAVGGSPADGELIQATLPHADLATATTASLSLFNPGPGGGSSSTIPFTVSVHPPEIDALSPGFIAPGGGDFTLTLTGADFDPSAVVYWNGNALITGYVSATELQATVPAADIAGAGVAKLTVVNPVATGGMSVPASFAVDASGSAVMSVAQPVNDIEWDPANFALYGATHAADTNYPHAIITLDPTTAAVSTSANVTNEADLLSLSKDDEFMYAAFSGAFERFALPGFTPDSSLPMVGAINGNAVYTALQVSPANAHVVATIFRFLTIVPPNFGGGVFIDSVGTDMVGTQEIWDTLGWSSDGTGLYAGDTEGSKASFIALGYSILDTSAPKINYFNGLWTGSIMHVDAASNLIYADNSTAVIDPSNATQVATFPVSGVMVPDSSLGCAYFITQTAAQVTAGNNDYTLSCYSTTDQSLTRSLVIPAVTGTPTKMMRWGNEGLVFMTDGGMIYFVSGQIVTGD